MWFLWENLKARDRMEDLGIHGRTTFECILKELGWRRWNGFIIFKNNKQWWVVVNTGVKIWVSLSAVRIC